MSKWFPVALGLGAGLVGSMLLKNQNERQQARQWLAGQIETGPGTAFITGASAGIGASFARALAQQGYNLVLLARREDRLRELADELRVLGSGRVTILAADLSIPEEVERAAQVLTEIPDLALLINNAGFGTGGRFSDIDIQPELRMIQVHINASVRLTRAALPGMIARGHGGVINVSSMASFLPMPWNTTYGATKAYLNFFTGSLNAELAGSGVRVQALCPGFTYSEFHDVAGMQRKVIPSFLWMQAEEVVAASLRGLRAGQELVIPGKLYQLMAWVIRFPPVAPLARQAQKLRLSRQGRME